MKIKFAIGSYTKHKSLNIDAQGRGLSIVAWDDMTGEYRILDEYGEITNPTYLDWRPETRRLYAVCAVGDGRGAVTAFSLSPAGTMDFLGRQENPGRSGCHLTALPDDGRIFAVSYSDGRLTGYGLVDGDVGPVNYTFSYSGSGPNAERQEAPHAHQVLKSPLRDVIYVCDLGSDAVWMHSLGNLGKKPVKALSLPAGCGPRHLDFDPVSPVAYVLCELIPKLFVVSIDASTGGMRMTQECDTVPADRAAGTAPAAVKVHPSGRSVAVSNRFDDTVTVYRIRRDKEVILEEAANFDCRGKTPRDVTFTPDGTALFMANQDSHTVTCRRFDPATGLPENDWLPVFQTGSPVCVVMLDS